MFCNLKFTIGEPSAYGGSLIFDSVFNGDVQYKAVSSFSIYNKSQTIFFLNSLSLGKWIAQDDGSGVIYTLLSHNTDTDVLIRGIKADDEDANIEPAEEDCTNTPVDEAGCLDCFGRIAALTDVCEPEDVNSCLYLNDIGFNKQKVEDLMTSDYESAVDFVRKAEVSGLKRLISKIYTFLGSNLKLNSVTGNGTIGYLSQNLSVVTSLGGKVGIAIQLKNSNGYIGIPFNSISLNVNYTGNVDVEIWDVMRNNLIDTVTVPCVPKAKNTVSIENIIKSNRELTQIALIYDSTGIDSYKTTVKSGLCCGKTSYNTEYFSSYGVQIDASDAVLNQNLNTVAHTSGLMVDYVTACNHEKWLCTLKPYLKEARLHETGISLLRNGLLKGKSQRVNNVITVAGGLQEEINFHEAEVFKYMTNLFQNMKLPNDSKCFVCNSRINIYNNPSA